ncbi:MAG: hypothetical protein AAFR45_02600 [Pseudomonadota bacterium]
MWSTADAGGVHFGGLSRELRILADNKETGVVRVGLDMLVPDPTTQWTVDGSMTTGLYVDVTVPPDGSEGVFATIPTTPITSLTAYYQFDRPPKVGAETFALTDGNIRDKVALTASTTSAWTPGSKNFDVAYGHILSQINPRDVTITGNASIDGNASQGKAQYNYLLSQRRAKGLRAFLNKKFPPGFTGTDSPSGGTVTNSWRTQWLGNTNPRNIYWVAEVTGFSVSPPALEVTGNITRPATPQIHTPGVPDTPPSDPATPDWFRSARLKVRIVRNQFVALELSGQIDFQTGVESAIQNGGVTQTPSIRGVGANPADGITDFLFLYQTDPASQTDEVKLYIGADPADRDGLVMTGQLPGQALQPAGNVGQNLLGMTCLFTPLLAAAAPPNPADGDLVPLALSAGAIGVATGLAQAGFFNVERVILFGGEGAFRRQGDLWQVSFLFDVETAVSVDLSFGGGSGGGGFTLLRIPRERPLAVRYKAIGLSFGEPPGGGGRFEFRPMFDSSKGYSIDVSGPGTIQVAEPLGNILQVAGARIARTNPLNFEIDLKFAVDLGVLSVDRARVRMPIDPLGPPELTAFGAGLKVPGVLEGKGYMEFGQNGGSTEIKGGLDLRLIPVKMRIAGQVAIAEIPESEGGPATGVAIALQVELPVAIPLAQSGLGIYGFLGLFAMHYTRDEDGLTSLTPALEWLKDRAQGDPSNLQAWKPQVDSWAFGAGITLGTMGSPVIFNVKGMFLLELPGPRVLLMVKANLLAVLPALKDKNAEGTFLCVIDLDFGRKTLTIGISIDFEIKPLVEISIPIEAFFKLDNGRFWHVYLGTFPGTDLQGNKLPGPIRASILGAFDGAGYVMFSGHGIPSYAPPGTNLPALSEITGFGIAAGLEVSLIWGNTSINLYLKVTAGFNAVIGFDPFYVGGHLYLRGELKLFIISLSASAALVVQVGERADGTEVSRIDGEVCGKLDLFFFSIEGCVDFHIGEDDTIEPAPPTLFAGASVVSRTPALVEGTGVDRGIDSKLGDMFQEGVDDANVKPLPVVPIDAIPVLSFAMPPLDGGITIFGESPEGATGAKADGFKAQGDTAFAYTLKEITVERVGETDVLLPGNAPSTWWTLEPPDGDNLTSHLSLLNWVPNPTPKALERSEILEETVKERWGTVCHPAAPAAPVLWTFNAEPYGPSATGWDLDGIAWPDPSNTRRSDPADVALHVRETWRSGDAVLDMLRGIIPATVEGALMPCLPKLDDDGGIVTPNDNVTTNTTPAGTVTIDRERFATLSDQPVLANEALLNALAESLTLGPGTLNDMQADRPAEDGAGIEARLDTNAFSTSFLGGLASDAALSSVRRTPFDGGVTINRDSFTALDATRDLDLVARVDADTLAGATATLATTAPQQGPDRLNFTEATRRVQFGEPVGRAALLNATAGIAAQQTSPNLPDFFDNLPKCPGKVLASPLWDTGAPVALGDRSQSDAIADQLAERGVKHGPLSDVVEVDTGLFIDGHVLMWVNRGLLNDDQVTARGIMIHYLDANDTVLDVRPVRFSDLLSVTSLPPRWVDVNGPWLKEIYPTVFYGQYYLTPRQAVCVKLEPPQGTEKFRIGALYVDEKQVTRFEQEGRPYYVGAIELTRMSEVRREDFDQVQVEKDRQVVENLLGGASADVALLHPNSTYRITARADVQSKTGTEAPQDRGEQTAVFTFQTDSAAPARLDPWMLFTCAAEGEAHVFTLDHPTLVFATNAVDKLYAAYGKELRVRLKAASFRQVDTPGVDHPFPITSATLDNVPAAVLSPFEATLQDLIVDKEDFTCVEADGDRIRHSKVTLPIPLDPYTDYLLDVEAVDIGAPKETVGDRVFRLSFATGQFGNMDAFAEDIQATLVEHRYVGTGAMQAIGSNPLFASRQPMGPELDEALMGAGLDPFGVPKAARVIVFWEQTTPASDPQPVAMLLDASEPLRRTRPLPEEVSEMDPDGVATKLWKATDQVWLDIGEDDGLAPADQIVSKVLFDPGKQRALVLLKPNARGKDLKLDLIRTEFAPMDFDGALPSGAKIRIVDEGLYRAPWEED